MSAPLPRWAKPMCLCCALLGIVAICGWKFHPQPKGQPKSFAAVKDDSPQALAAEHLGKSDSASKSDSADSGASVSPVWPQPATASIGTAAARVLPCPGFFVASKVSLLLDAAFHRYGPVMFPHSSPAITAGSLRCAAAPGAITQLRVEVQDADESHPQLTTDESYSLQVPVEGTAVATAKTVFGALRALETFSQLVAYDFESLSYVVADAPWNITDFPRFSHRGLMIDSARHYLPLAAIRGVIDSLPYAKLNVLHWHMVDAQSFPFQSTSSPKLWMGAYSPTERYTQEDVASIVEYARLRGVRVMVEFDTPGHADSWCTGYPDICPSATCKSPLNVASNTTFKLVEDLLGECTGRVRSAQGKPSGLFPDDFVHLGGDEVDTSCWTKTPEVAAWLASNKMTADEAYAYFVGRVAAVAEAQGRRPVQWSEVFDHFKGKLSKQTIVHVWKPNTNVTEVVALGYDVIRNVGYYPNSWYLDNLGITWDAVYGNDPCAGIPSDDLCAKVLGGHGEMWGETVDGSDIQQTVWPRLAAVAEKLWSPRAVTQNATAATDRIRSFRCLLLERGVPAPPVDNAQAREAPAGPASCYRQPGRHSIESVA